MKLTLNASRVPFNPTGIFRYAKIIINTLEKMKFELHSLRSNTTLAVPGTVQDIPTWLSNKKRSRYYPVYWYLYAMFIKIPKNQPILSVTQHLLPFRKDQVISILDMRPAFEPDNFLQKFYARVLFPISIGNIRAVITISEASKSEVAQAYNIDPKIIHVVYLYADTKLVFQDPRRERKPYLLMVGASFKHKNVHLALLNHGAWRSDYRLVLIATDNRYTRQMMALAESLGITDSVEFRFRTTDTEKEELLQNASALIYISSMEGFGIPPLEALGCGTPCLLSPIPVLTELYQDTAIFFDPAAPHAWITALAQLKDTDRVAGMIENGYRRFAEFGPERTHSMLEVALKNIYGELPN
jgi:glycosyltransferase involved in cell wall biosynthesis